MADARPEHYVPALKYRWLTPYYDRLVSWTTRESLFRQKLLDQANPGENDKVLDLACGTGTMALMIKARHPSTAVAGLDGDPEILALAREKTRKAGLDIEFNEALSSSMPYPSNEFDIVFSSLFFHHLKPAEKARTLTEVIRVLKPGGRFHVCDWGRPANPALRAAFLVVQMLDGFEVTRENVEGRLPVIIQEAGFEKVLLTSNVATMLGTLSMISAKKPVS
jgi:ubiquinone/menaquinone biosynthesis C-methylase UbiE